MNKKTFIALLFWFLTLSAYPLSTIKGNVFDSNSHEPLHGAFIYIHEFEKGAVTNDEGEFVMEDIPTSEITIQVSFVGYETKIIKINETSSLKIELKPTLVETPEVVVTASNFASQHENAIKIEAISKSSIDGVATPSFVEAIAAIPGLDVISKGNGIGKPVIRGMSNSNVLFLNNGIKMENYQFSEDHPYVTDETGIDHIEVIKGPASLLYGSDAIGGLINILPEHPAVNGKTEGDLSIKVNTVSNGLLANAGVKKSTDNWSWGIRGGMKNHRDYLDGNGDFVPNSRFSQQSARSFLNFNSKKGYFKLSYEFNHLEPGMTNNYSVPLVTENAYEKEFWYQNLTNHIVLSKNTFFIQKIKLNANVSYQVNHRRLNTDEIGEVNMQLGSTSYELKSWIPTNKHSDLIVGFQGAIRQNTNLEAHARVLPDYDENDFALMGLYQHRFADRLSLQAGMRYDFRNLFIPEQEKASHSHNQEEERDEEEVSELMPEQSHHYQNYSFSVGTTWEIVKELLLRANVATAFRPPNVAELTQNGVHGVRYELGNTDLNSQRNVEGDLSVHFHTSNLSADVATFYNAVSNYIYLSPTNEFNEDYRIYQYQQHNAMLYGNEISLRYHPLDWLETEAQFEYIRGNLQSEDNLPFIPHDKLKSRVNIHEDKLWKIQNPSLKVQWVHAFDQSRPSEFETKSPAYNLINASIEGDFPIGKQNLNLALRANNLFNELYIDHLSTLKDLGFYNPGRNVMLSIQYKFR